MKNVSLAWIKGHFYNTGNELADYLAKQGNTIQTPNYKTPLPKKEAHSLIENEIHKRWTEDWESHVNQFKHTKYFIEKPGDAKNLLSYSRKELRNLVNFITGHIPLNKHLYAMNKSDTDKCRFCNGQEKETPIHILECEALFKLPRSENEDLIDKIKLYLNDSRILDVLNK